MKTVNLSGLFSSQILPVEGGSDEAPCCDGAVHGPDKTGTNNAIISLSKEGAQEAQNASINKDLLLFSGSLK